MNHLLQALRTTRHSFRMIWWLYGINALLSLLILLPAYATLKTEMGHSMAFTSLLPGLDDTVFSDFMSSADKATDPLLFVGRWLGFLWLIVSVFLSGGILLRFAQPEGLFVFSQFQAGCATYFRRFLSLLGVTTLFFGVLFVITVLVGTLVGAALYNRVTEQALFTVGVVTLVVAILLSALIFCIGDYAKVLLFRRDDRNPFRAFGRAGRLVLLNLGRTFGPYLALMGIGTALFGVYFLIDDLITMRNWPTILILFVVQQVFIAARVFLKVWTLGTAYNVSTTLIIPAPLKPPVLLKPLIDPTPLIKPEDGIVTSSSAD